MIIGLTGGIGSGKSAAAKIFAGLGARTIDADCIVADLLATDAEVHAALRAAFGDGVFDAEERVDKRALAAIVFNENGRLEVLEGILHPRVRRAWQSRVQEDPEAFWVVEIPLLFEKNLENLFDLTVCVSADLLTRLVRLEHRGVPPEEARRRIKNQLPLDEKCQRADYVISNSGSLAFLREQIVRLMDTLACRH